MGPELLSPANDGQSRLKVGVVLADSRHKLAKQCRAERGVAVEPACRDDPQTVRGLMRGDVGIDAVGDDLDTRGIELVLFNKEALDVLADRYGALAPKGEGAAGRRGIVKSVRRDGKGRKTAAF